MDKIASQPGVRAIFAASAIWSNFSGYKQGDPDYERTISIVHDAALRAHVQPVQAFRLGGPSQVTCFQNTTEDGAIAAGMKAELGRLAIGQAEVGPFFAPANQLRR